MIRLRPTMFYRLQSFEEVTVDLMTPSENTVAFSSVPLSGVGGGRYLPLSRSRDARGGTPRRLPSVSPSRGGGTRGTTYGRV